MLGSFSRASRSFSSNQCSRAEGADAVMQSKMKFSVKNWAEYDAGLRRRGSLTLWITAEVLDGWQAARRTTPGGQPSYFELSVKNWAEYDAGLRRRGSLTLWITAEVLDGWQAARRTTPGGQPSYSELAIETGMMLGLAFHLALRQTEGLMASIFGLLDVPLSAPDHSTLSRRARKMKSISNGCILPDGPIHLLIDSTGLKMFGAGEWLQEKHGAKARRTWKKLHLAVDADTGMIMASTLTGNDVGDPSQVAPLLDQIEATVASVTADGAYDGMPTYDVVAAHGEDIRVIIPPHVTAVLSDKPGHNPSQRD